MRILTTVALFLSVSLAFALIAKKRASTDRNTVYDQRFSTFNRSLPATSSMASRSVSTHSDRKQVRHDDCHDDEHLLKNVL